MKKIMIYSKHRNSGFHTSAEGIKNINEMILFFCLFLCGVFLGSALYLSENAKENVFAGVSDILLENSIPNNSILLLSGNGIAFIICVIASLSCAGIGLLAGIPFFQGILYSLLATNLIISDGAQGLSFFSLLILPAAVLSVTATISLCGFSAASSKRIARSIFTGGSESMEIRPYLRVNLLHFGILSASAAVYYICAKLFYSLF